MQLYIYFFKRTNLRHFGNDVCHCSYPMKPRQLSIISNHLTHTINTKAAYLHSLNYLLSWQTSKKVNRYQITQTIRKTLWSQADFNPPAPDNPSQASANCTGPPVVTHGCSHSTTSSLLYCLPPVSLPPFSPHSLQAALPSLWLPPLSCLFHSTRWLWNLWNLFHHSKKHSSQFTTHPIIRRIRFLTIQDIICSAYTPLC